MSRALDASSQSAYRQVRRFGGLFHAALQNPIPPQTTAGVIRQIVESGTWQLRHLSGPDAPAFVGWRADMSDEEWVDWSALEDEAWYERVQTDFGLNARPDAKAERAAGS